MTWTGFIVTMGVLGASIILILLGAVIWDELRYRRKVDE